MTALFDLTTTYVIATGTAATSCEGGDEFWRRLSAADPTLASADGGWLISSYVLTESWNKWEMHPRGDEVLHCRSGACELVLDLPDGHRTLHLTSGSTLVVPQSAWHTAKVVERAELLHITYGSGTTFRPLTN